MVAATVERSGEKKMDKVETVALDIRKRKSGNATAGADMADHVRISTAKRFCAYFQPGSWQASWTKCIDREGGEVDTDAGEKDLYSVNHSAGNYSEDSISVSLSGSIGSASTWQMCKSSNANDTGTPKRWSVESSDEISSDPSIKNERLVLARRIACSDFGESRRRHHAVNDGRVPEEDRRRSNLCWPGSDGQRGGFRNESYLEEAALIERLTKDSGATVRRQPNYIGVVRGGFAKGHVRKEEDEEDVLQTSTGGGSDEEDVGDAATVSVSRESDFSESSEDSGVFARLGNIKRGRSCLDDGSEFSVESSRESGALKVEQSMPNEEKRRRDRRALGGGTRSREKGEEEFSFRGLLSSEDNWEYERHPAQRGMHGLVEKGIARAEGDCGDQNSKGPVKFVFSSGRMTSYAKEDGDGDSKMATKKLTIDEEFELHFAQLLI